SGKIRRNTDSEKEREERIDARNGGVVRWYGPDIALKALPTTRPPPPWCCTSALAPQQRLDCPASQPVEIS
ncbi:unnamed protein product, partial [Heterotrigona itama]